jgi:type IV pilus assembly protein PilV
MTRFGTIRRSGRKQQGFSMLEVLIALVVLAVGLLGLALLQTVNLRYTKSAEQRTKATNLAGAILDTMRTNRSELASYAVEEDGFDDVDASGGCELDAALNAASNLEHWMCEVKEALGPDADGSITIVGSNVRVQINWSEDNLPSLTGGATVVLESVL